LLEQFNILDWVILLVGAVFVVKALTKGLLRELGSLLGLLLATIGGFTFYQPVAGFLRRVVGITDFWWEAAAFILCFILVYLGIVFISTRISRVLHRSPLSFFDRILGACLGFIKGVLLCYLLINILLMAQPLANFAYRSEGLLSCDLVSKSYLAPAVTRCGHFMLGFIPDNFIESLQEKAGLLQERIGDDPPPGSSQ
jgi:membrane protein required for colicin V production